MKFWFFLLLTAGLFATVNEPLRCDAFSGYRNDRIHWHLQEPGGVLTYSEVYRDVEYWENGLTFKVIHRDLTFFLRGAYGTFGRGVVNQRYATGEQPHFRFDTDGWTADGAGYFGYAVNLTADRVYKVLLTPLVGYSAAFEQLHRYGLPGVFRLVWNGFLLGVGVTAEPVGRLVLNAGYSYHFLHNRVHTAFQSPFDGYQSVKESSGGNHGHTGWAQMDCKINRLWRCGIGGMIRYFSTRVVDPEIVQNPIEQRFKLRWTSVSGWAQLSREF